MAGTGLSPVVTRMTGSAASDRLASVADCGPAGDHPHRELQRDPVLLGQGRSRGRGNGQDPCGNLGRRSTCAHAPTSGLPWALFGIATVSPRDGPCRKL